MSGAWVMGNVTSSNCLGNSVVVLLVRLESLLVKQISFICYIDCHIFF